MRIHIRIPSVVLWKKMTHGVREIYYRKWNWSWCQKSNKFHNPL